MTRNWAWTVAAVGLLSVAGILGAACGSSEPSPNDTPLVEAGAGDEMTFTLGGEGGTMALAIAPADQTLDVTGPGTSLAYTALVNGQASHAQWSIDVADIGTIDANGLFKASGTLGGPTRIYARVGNLEASTTLSVRLHLSDNPGNVDTATQAKLRAGGTADTAFKWLYPYDKTVFPRGLPAPTLQWSTNADAIYLHVTCKGLDYQGFYGASTPARIALSEALWKTMTLSATGGDPVKVEVTKITGGAVTGPISETWPIAQGSLKGTVYYNSYNSKLAGNTGAVLTLKVGQTAPTVLLTGCSVCHSVSADGSTLVSAREPVSGMPAVSDKTVDLKTGKDVFTAPNRTWIFGGLYPDGSVMMKGGAAAGGWPPNVRGFTGPTAATLLDPRTGTTIPAPGWDNVVKFALMPAFAPDGKKISFTHYDTGMGHTLGVMDFEKTTHTFSNLVDVVNEPSMYVGWPSFAPTEWLVYHAGTSNQYGTNSETDPAAGPKGDLGTVHLPSKTSARLDQLNGISGGGTYLPFGDPGDAHMNYEPTILPVAAGGYYWVVFTSRRNYGNTINSGPYDPGSPRKKLWVAALDIDSNETPSVSAHDISHPAFYLPGQELESGNMRGFWVLDPCKQNGNSCETGDECCNGFCRQSSEADGGLAFVCTQPTGCAHELEKCTTAADCCDESVGAQCLSGFCSKPATR